MSARVIDRYFRLRHPFTVTATYIQQFFDFSRIGRTTLFSSHSNVAIHDRHNPPRESGNHDVTSRLKWNTPELHSAQPLDYLSQFYLDCYTNTCYILRVTEAVRELESTGQKSTGICTGCTAADRHSTAELEVNLKHVI